MAWYIAGANPHSRPKRLASAHRHSESKHPGEYILRADRKEPARRFARSLGFCKTMPGDGAFLTPIFERVGIRLQHFVETSGVHDHADTVGSGTALFDSKENPGYTHLRFQIVWERIPRRTAELREELDLSSGSRSTAHVPDTLGSTGCAALSCHRSRTLPAHAPSANGEPTSSPSPGCFLGGKPTAPLRR